MDLGKPNPLKQFFAVVVIPTFNHAGTLPNVLTGVARLGLPVIVVDDGSMDRTSERIAEWIAGNPHADLEWTSHDVNRGKAAALRTGFNAAGARGATHVVTIDSDGQLDPSDAPALLAMAEGNPRALVLGRRPDAMPRCPRRCAMGRRFASLAIRAQCGLRISDSQCGFRVYPIELVRNLRCAGGRYSFEAEIITRAVWAGYEVLESPVRCQYFAPQERVSHYRPWLDTARQMALHVRLLLRAALPWPLRADELIQQRRPNDSRSWWRRLGSWMNPVRCWRESVQCDVGLLELGAAVALGVWIGTTPLYGLHVAICMYFAWRLHLHPAAMILGSQISIPPLGIALAIASTWVGHVLLTGRIAGADSVDTRWGIFPSFNLEILSAWGVGSLILGFFLALCAFGVVLLLGYLRRN